MKIVKTFFSIAAISALGIGFSILASVLLARWMSVEDFGDYSFAIAIATVAAIPVSIGLPLLLTREVSEAVLRGDVRTFRCILTAGGIWVAGAAVVVGLGIQVIRATHPVSPDTAHLLSIISFLPVAMGIVALCAGTLKGINLPVYSEVLSQIFLPLCLVLGLVAMKQTSVATAGTALKLYLAAYFVAALAGLILLARNSPILFIPERASATQIRAWGMSFISFTLIGGMSTLSTQLATLFLGSLGQTEELAFLRVAERGALLVAFPLMFINAIIGPYIVTAHREAGKDALKKLARDAARLSTLTSIPVALVLVLFGKPLIAVTFGESYAETAYLPMAVISVGQIVSVMLGSGGMFLAMCGHEKINLYGHALSILVMLSCVGFLAPLYGALGAAIGVAFGLIILKVFLSFAMRRKMGFHPGLI